MGKIILILIFFIIFTIISESLAQMSKTIIVGTTYNIFHEEFSNDKDFFKQVDVDIPLIKMFNINHIMILFEHILCYNWRNAQMWADN